MTYLLASEGVERSQRQSLGGGGGVNVRRAATQFPDGLCHAVPEGETVTVCGKPDLKVWPQLWQSAGGYTRCGTCVEFVPIDPADT